MDDSSRLEDQSPSASDPSAHEEKGDTLLDLMEFKAEAELRMVEQASYIRQLEAQLRQLREHRAAGSAAVITGKGTVLTPAPPTAPPPPAATVQRKHLPDVTMTTAATAAGQPQKNDGEREEQINVGPLSPVSSPLDSPRVCSGGGEEEGSHRPFPRPHSALSGGASSSSSLPATAGVALPHSAVIPAPSARGQTLLVDPDEKGQSSRGPAQMEELVQWNQNLIATVERMQNAVAQMDAEYQSQMVLLQDETRRTRERCTQLDEQNKNLLDRLASDILLQKRREVRALVAQDQHQKVVQVRRAGRQRLEAMEAMLLAYNDDLYYRQRCDGAQMPQREATLVFLYLSDNQFTQLPVFSTEEEQQSFHRKGANSFTSLNESLRNGKANTTSQPNAHNTEKKNKQMIESIFSVYEQIVMSIAKQYKGRRVLLHVMTSLECFLFEHPIDALLFACAVQEQIVKLQWPSDHLFDSSLDNNNNNNNNSTAAKGGKQQKEEQEDAAVAARAAAAERTKEQLAFLRPIQVRSLQNSTMSSRFSLTSNTILTRQSPPSKSTMKTVYRGPRPHCGVYTCEYVDIHVDPVTGKISLFGDLIQKIVLSFFLQAAVGEVVVNKRFIDNVCVQYELNKEVDEKQLLSVWKDVNPREDNNNNNNNDHSSHNANALFDYAGVVPLVKLTKKSSKPQPSAVHFDNQIEYLEFILNDRFRGAFDVAPYVSTSPGILFSGDDSNNNALQNSTCVMKASILPASLQERRLVHPAQLAPTPRYPYQSPLFYPLYARHLGVPLGFRLSPPVSSNATSNVSSANNSSSSGPGATRRENTIATIEDIFNKTSLPILIAYYIKMLKGHTPDINDLIHDLYRFQTQKRKTNNSSKASSIKSSGSSGGTSVGGGGNGSSLDGPDDDDDENDVSTMSKRSRESVGGGGGLGRRRIAHIVEPTEQERQANAHAVDEQASRLLEYLALKNERKQLLKLLKKTLRSCEAFEHSNLEKEDQFIVNRRKPLHPSERAFVCTFDIGEDAFWLKRVIFSPLPSTDTNNNNNVNKDYDKSAFEAMQQSIRQFIQITAQQYYGFYMNGNLTDIFTYVFREVEQVLAFVSEIYIFVNRTATKYAKSAGEVYVFRAGLSCGTMSSIYRHLENNALKCTGPIIRLSATLCDLAQNGEILAMGDVIAAFHEKKDNLMDVQYNIVKQQPRGRAAVAGDVAAAGGGKADVDKLAHDIAVVHSILPKPFAYRRRRLMESADQQPNGDDGIDAAMSDDGDDSNNGSGSSHANNSSNNPALGRRIKQQQKKERLRRQRERVRRGGIAPRSIKDELFSKHRKEQLLEHDVVVELLEGQLVRCERAERARMAAEDRFPYQAEQDAAAAAAAGHRATDTSFMECENHWIVIGQRDHYVEEGDGDAKKHHKDKAAKKMSAHEKTKEEANASNKEEDGHGGGGQEDDDAEDELMTDDMKKQKKKRETLFFLLVDIANYKEIAAQLEAQYNQQEEQRLRELEEDMSRREQEGNGENAEDEDKKRMSGSHARLFTFDPDTVLQHMLESYHYILQRVAVTYHGSVLKNDGEHTYCMVFPTVDDCLQASYDIQLRCNDYTGWSPALRTLPACMLVREVAPLRYRLQVSNYKQQNNFIKENKLEEAFRASKPAEQDEKGEGQEDASVDTRALKAGTIFNGPRPRIALHASSSYQWTIVSKAKVRQYSNKQQPLHQEQQQQQQLEESNAKHEATHNHEKQQLRFTKINVTGDALKELYFIFKSTKGGEIRLSAPVYIFILQSNKANLLFDYMAKQRIVNAAVTAAAEEGEKSKDEVLHGSSAAASATSQKSAGRGGKKPGSKGKGSEGAKHVKEKTQATHTNQLEQVLDNNFVAVPKSLEKRLTLLYEGATFTGAAATEATLESPNGESKRTAHVFEERIGTATDPASGKRKKQSVTHAASPKRMPGAETTSTTAAAAAEGGQQKLAAALIPQPPWTSSNARWLFSEHGALQPLPVPQLHHDNEDEQEQQHEDENDESDGGSSGGAGGSHSSARVSWMSEGGHRDSHLAQEYHSDGLDEANQLSGMDTAEMQKMGEQLLNVLAPPPPSSTPPADGEKALDNNNNNNNNNTVNSVSTTSSSYAEFLKEYISTFISAMKIINNHDESVVTPISSRSNSNILGMNYHHQHSLAGSTSGATGNGSRRRGDSNNKLFSSLPDVLSVAAPSGGAAAHGGKAARPSTSASGGGGGQHRRDTSRSSILSKRRGSASASLSSRPITRSHTSLTSTTAEPSPSAPQNASEAHPDAAEESTPKAKTEKSFSSIYMPPTPGVCATGAASNVREELKKQNEDAYYQFLAISHLQAFCTRWSNRRSLLTLLSNSYNPNNNTNNNNNNRQHSSVLLSSQRQFSQHPTDHPGSTTASIVSLNLGRNSESSLGSLASHTQVKRASRRSSAASTDVPVYTVNRKEQ